MRKIHGAITAASTDKEIKTKPNSPRSLVTEILTHRKFVKLQYDVILGKPWLYKHNPKIDYRNNHVEFNDADQDTGAAEPAVRGLAPTGETKEELIVQQGRVDEESDLYFMTAKAARKAIRKGADWYMLRVQDLCSQESEAEINLLDAKPSVGTGTG